MRNIAADNIADLESIETSEWLDSLDYVLQSQRSRARGAAAAAAQRSCAAPRHQAAVHREHAVREHADDRSGSAVSRQPGDRAPHQEPRAVERDCHGAAREQERAGYRRPYLDVRVRGDAVRSRVQSFLQVRHAPAIATSCITRGMRRPASTRARFSKGASPKSSSTISAASSRRAADCRRIRIRG